MSKDFDNYSDAYSLYSDITSNRDPDRKNATVFYVMKANGNYVYRVMWEPIV